jgi:membrane fusion protein, multidrug efflux system
MPSGNSLETYRRFLIGSPVIIMGIFFLLFAQACGKKEKPAAPAPPTVEVVDVIQKDVPVYSEWVAALDGMVNATIRAQVQGYLVQQLYKEGDFVKTGQLLFQIDPRTFKAALDQAKADLARNEARWTQTKANLARVRPLAARNAVSQKDLDDAIAAEESGQASTEAAKATVDKAQLNLEFTRIISPIDGVSGIAKAQIGNLVGPGATEELTSVSTVNPVKAYISVSEQEYMQAQGDRTKGTGKRPLELILADGSTWPHKGEFFVADRQVDARTGTIRVAATFSNPENILRPGQFARVRARMALKKDALLIPQRAVSETQGKYLVAVMGPENKIAIKQVKAAERYGQLWVIEEGLTAGDKVVAEGIQKVRDGMAVTPKPFETQPGAKLEAGAPAPAKPDASQKAGPKPEAQRAPKKR